MKFSAVLLTGALPILAAAQEPKAAAKPAPQVRTVYLLAMTNGLDQYLANRLTKSGAVRVVSDPKKADMLLTDRLGDAFESRLEEIFPDEKPAPAAAPDKKPAPKEPREAKGSQEFKDPDAAGLGNYAAPPLPFSAFRRAKGTVFLVDAHARTVLWSTYEQPKNATGPEMDRTAGRIAQELKHHVHQERKAQVKSGE